MTKAFVTGKLNMTTTGASSAVRSIAAGGKHIVVAGLKTLQAFFFIGPGGLADEETHRSKR
ncbi:MAG: hypothetical protein V3S39_07030 [Thermodesulfobacteriota bacterium]